MTEVRGAEKVEYPSVLHRRIIVGDRRGSRLRRVGVCTVEERHSVAVIRPEVLIHRLHVVHALHLLVHAYHSDVINYIISYDNTKKAN
jgi:hypothetical protein